MISRYNHPEIARIWSDNNRYLLWTQIELAFLSVFKDIRITTPEIFYDEWVQEIQEIERVTKHDVGAFVQWLEERFLYPILGEESRWVHYGLTSSDILDTCFSMQIRETNLVLVRLAEEASDMFTDLAVHHSDYDILGRTHGQAAETIALSQKLYSYSDALYLFKPAIRDYDGRIAGSVGDYKYIEQTLEQQALRRLGLKPSCVKDGQIIHRGYYAHFMNEWALLASAIEKIATDIRLLAQSEIGEILEGFSKGQVGSSSMPHKRNPILCENLCGLARVIRGYQMTAMQNIALWNERDISNSSVERIIFPDAAVILGFMLKRLKDVVEFLVIDTERMSENIQKFGSGIDSQQQMLDLIKAGSTRKEAHELLRAQNERGGK